MSKDLNNLVVNGKALLNRRWDSILRENETKEDFTSKIGTVGLKKLDSKNGKKIDEDHKRYVKAKTDDSKRAKLVKEFKASIAKELKAKSKPAKEELKEIKKEVADSNDSIKSQKKEMLKALRAFKKLDRKEKKGMKASFKEAVKTAIDRSAETARSLQTDCNISLTP